MTKRIIGMILLIIMLSAAIVSAVPVSAAGGWIDPEDKEPPKDYAYSFVFIGDTQTISIQDVQNNTNYFSCIYDWIVENKEERKIEYVFGLGDITDRDWETTGPQEWALASENIHKLDGVVPYSMAIGNHDSNARFYIAFNKEPYSSQFNGTYGWSIENTWRTITIGRDDYLMITLTHGPEDDVLEWANGVISEHPNHRTIITTHWYLAPDGYPGDINDYGSAKPLINNHGTEIWKKLVTKHKNIFMVASGHYSCNDLVIHQQRNSAGGTVTHLLTDPQSMDNGIPVGMIAILYFSEDGKTIETEYYSTVRNQYYMAHNQKTINIPKQFVNAAPAQTTALTTEAATETPPATTTTTTDVTEPVSTTALPYTEVTVPKTTPPDESDQSGCKGALALPCASAAAVSATAALLTSRKKRKRR